MLKLTFRAITKTLECYVLTVFMKEVEKFVHKNQSLYWHLLDIKKQLSSPGYLPCRSSHQLVFVRCPDETDQHNPYSCLFAMHWFHSTRSDTTCQDRLTSHTTCHDQQIGVKIFKKNKFKKKCCSCNNMKPVTSD